MSNANSTAYGRSFLASLRSLVGAPSRWVPDPFELASLESQCWIVADSSGHERSFVFLHLLHLSLSHYSLGNDDLSRCYLNILNAVEGVCYA